MGNCIYCGKSSGFFRNKHPECENTFNEGVALLKEYVHSFFINDNSFDVFQQKIEIIRANYFIDIKQYLSIIFQEWGRYVQTLNKLESISEESINKLVLIKTFYYENNDSQLEQAFGPIKIKNGQTIKYYFEELLVDDGNGDLVKCKNEEGEFKFVHKTRLKYFTIISPC